jgi:SAM-dependent methyltransferase
MHVKLYDEMCEVEQNHWWFQARRSIVQTLVRRYIGGPRRRRLRICELGCGTGGNLAELAREHDVLGVECSPHALIHARRRLGHRVLGGSLPDDVDLPPDSFDVVLLTDVLEHIEDDTRSAQTAVRLLRPGGIVVATVPAYQWLYSPRDAHHHHVRRYSKRRFSSLWTTPESRIELVSHYNTLLFAPAAVVRLISKYLPFPSAPGDLITPPAILNMALAHTLQSEANLLGRLPLPFGLSLVSVARKTSSIASETRAAA